MFNRIIFVAILSLFSLTACQTTPADHATTVTDATLENGLHYQIHNKHETSGKIQLRLLVKTGSLNETEQQAGYAHLLEHMAFNGTKHFPKNRIIELFEKSGLTFGQDINAYTHFDRTVYILSLPKDDPQLLAETLLYLRDLLTDINISDSELNKEKGVVQNEYLAATPIDKPYQWARFDDYIKGYDYQQHMPIGTLDSVQQATPEGLNAYYKTWYQPNNAKLLIVGDVDSEAVQSLIVQTFADASNAQENITNKALQNVALSNEVKAYSNSLSSFSQSDLAIQLDYIAIHNSQDLANAMQQRLVINLINYRLQATNNLRSQPFEEVGIYQNDLVFKNALANIYIQHSQTKYQQAVEFVALEMARIKEHGFAQNEIDLQLDNLKSAASTLKSSYANQDSAQIANTVVDAWAIDETPLTLALEEQAYTLLFAAADLVTLNQASSTLLNQPSLWSFAYPYQQPKPNLEKLLSAYQTESNKLTSAIIIQDQILTMPVITQYAGDKNIQSETIYQAKNITKWQLKNGLTVVLLPTDAETDQIEMSLNAPGGLNALQPEQQEAAYLLIPSYSKSPMAGVDLNALNLKFTKANAGFTPYLESNSHGFTMSSINKPESLTLLFSVLYSTFTSAELDPIAFAAEKKQLIENQSNFLSQPIAATINSINEALFPNNAYNKMLTIEAIKKVQAADLTAIYQQLFSSANGYQLTIVGDFKIAEIKPLILRYMATIPSGEKQQFANKPQPLIAQAKSIIAYTNPNDGAYISYTAVTNTPNKSIKEVYQADILGRIITQKLNQVVREELSLTYTPQAYVSDQQAGTAFTQFGVNITSKTEDALKTQQVLDGILADFLENGFTQAQLDDHKKGLAYGMSTMLVKPADIKWLLNRDQLQGYALNSTENAQAIVDSISLAEMNQFVKAYAAPEQMLKFVNYPAK